MGKMTEIETIVHVKFAHFEWVGKLKILTGLRTIQGAMCQYAYYLESSVSSDALAKSPAEIPRILAGSASAGNSSTERSLRWS